LRCNIARLLLHEGYRAFAVRLADSPLLQHFCGVSRLEAVRVPSKSTLQRYDAETWEVLGLFNHNSRPESRAVAFDRLGSTHAPREPAVDAGSQVRAAGPGLVDTLRELIARPGHAPASLRCPGQRRVIQRLASLPLVCSKAEAMARASAPI